MFDQKDNLKKFVVEFFSKVSNYSQFNDKELVEFNLAVSKGTGSETNINLRVDLMIKRFLAEYNPLRLDEERLFSYEQKLEIYHRDNEICQICKKKLIFKDKDTQYHHKGQYMKGGKTETKNGLLVCSQCHLNDIHGKEKSKKNS